MQTAERVTHFGESVIRKMTRLAMQHDAINLSQGFPDFEPSPELVEAAVAALRGGILSMVEMIRMLLPGRRAIVLLLVLLPTSAAASTGAPDRVLDEAKRDPQKVSRNLGVLKQEGLVREIYGGDRRAHYDADTSRHAHFICDSCDQIIDVRDVLARVQQPQLVATWPSAPGATTSPAGRPTPAGPTSTTERQAV